MAEFNLGRVKGDPWKIPIGFEYWQSPNGKDPKTLFGEENWLDVSDEYKNAFVRVKGSLNPTGAKQEEGLPNLEGTFYHQQLIRDQLIPTTGVFSNTWVGNHNYRVGTTLENSMQIVTFNAKSYNKIYGNSTHVTPLNYGWTLWRKVDPSEI